jgi:GAF domain-containing protein
MSDEQALKIILERRGVMYDPLVVDTFVASYQRVMPAPEAAPHPVARAIGDARALEKKERAVDAAASSGADVTDGLLAVTSLSRAMAGQAGVADVGALIWMIVRQVIPCQAMAIFLPDERTDQVAIRFAAGSHAHMLRGISRPSGSGIAGWVAVNQRAAVNADAALDLGLRAADLTPALRSCLAVPLVESDALIAVLAVYRERPNAFSDDDLRLVELLAPRLASCLLEPAIAEEDAAAPAAAVVAVLGAPSPALKLVKRSATFA